jgi:hypothetical protein
MAGSRDMQDRAARPITPGPADGEATLPVAPFAELAVELGMIAFREALGAEALEGLAARNPVPTFVNTLAQVRRDAELAAQAAALIKALIPVEAQVRALVLAGRSAVRSAESCSQEAGA